MITNEAQANPNTVIGTMFVLGISAQVLFDSRSSRYFVSIVFALYADRKLARIKNKYPLINDLFN